MKKLRIENQEFQAVKLTANETLDTRGTGSDVFVIPEKLSIYKDDRTGARSMSIPLDFPDGSHGVLIVTRLENESWIPSKSMKTITITWQ